MCGHTDKEPTGRGPSKLSVQSWNLCVNVYSESSMPWACHCITEASTYAAVTVVCDFGAAGGKSSVSVPAKPTNFVASLSVTHWLAGSSQHKLFLLCRVTRSCRNSCVWFLQPVHRALGISKGFWYFRLFQGFWYFRLCSVWVSDWAPVETKYQFKVWTQCTTAACTDDSDLRHRAKRRWLRWGTGPVSCHG
jgi:hypothetical protein